MPSSNEPIRDLFAREHATVFPKLGVFLAGVTPPDETMLNGWRRKIVNELKNDTALDPSMIVVSPEPRQGYWKDIEVKLPNQPELSQIINKQIPWEWQYLQLCDITAFWLPTYWNEEKSENFPPNIGPTSRLEFGFFLQEFLKSPAKRSFIVGSPEDADSIKWAKRITDMYGIKWHILPKNQKTDLVADSFIEEIKQSLLKNKWAY